MISFSFVVLYCILGINIIVCLYFLNAHAESTSEEQGFVYTLLLEDSVAKKTLLSLLF